MTTIQTRFKIRRDTAANWTSANPVLLLGEPGLETDTNKVKYGDGSTEWSSLPYAGSSAAWGNITGTLASQTDLLTALNLKAALAGATFTGEVVVGNLAAGYSRFRVSNNLVIEAGFGSSRFAVSINGDSSFGTSSTFGNTGAIRFNTTGGGNALIGGSSATAHALILNPGSGNVGIGKANPSAKLDVVGTVAATGLTLTGLVNATNDAGAASGGVAIGGVYRNGSVLMIRVS